MKYPRMTAATVDPAEAAEQAVRRYCGWHVAPLIEEKFRLDGHGSSVVKLPTLALDEVLDVQVAGRPVALDRVQWSTNGLLRLPAPAPREFGAVVVTVRHGFEDATDIGALVAGIRDRSTNMPAGVTRKQIGDVSVTYGGLDERGVRLFASEREALAPYRLEGTP